jgi:SAM-dependent methyltransferase
MLSPNRLRAAVPSSWRRWLKRLPGSAAVDAGLDELTLRLSGPPEELWQQSRERWRRSSPDASLTWGLEVRGEAFVRRIAALGGFGAEKHLLELGPGYGRLLRACLELELPFRSYLGVDISPQNVAFLESRFGRNPRLTFLCADFERADLVGPFETVFSSLTFKHLYPSFLPALAQLSPGLAPEALVVFDLIEGHRRTYHAESGTYVRCYKRAEVTHFVKKAGLALVGYDRVEHAPGFVRLLVAARKPAE